MSREVLATGLQRLGLSLSETQVTQLLDYLALLQKWNKVYNLTAVRDPAEMLTHHLLDSLAAIPPLLRQTAGEPVRLLDVGSGGGLPGVVIAIVCPQIDVSCVDTVGKKAAFIQQAAATLKLPNLRGVHARVETLEGRAGRWLRCGLLAGLCVAGGFHQLVPLGAQVAWRLDGHEGQAP